MNQQTKITIGTRVRVITTGQEFTVLGVVEGGKCYFQGHLHALTIVNQAGEVALTSHEAVVIWGSATGKRYDSEIVTVGTRVRVNATSEEFNVEGIVASPGSYDQYYGGHTSDVTIIGAPEVASMSREPADDPGAVIWGS